MSKWTKVSKKKGLALHMLIERSWFKILRDLVYEVSMAIHVVYMLTCGNYLNFISATKKSFPSSFNWVLLHFIEKIGVWVESLAIFQGYGKVFLLTVGKVSFSQYYQLLYFI